MKKNALLMLLLLAGAGGAHANVQRTLFRADLVASACHVAVEVPGGGNRLVFGTYRKSTRAAVPPQTFTVRLYERGASLPGCSAFRAGRLATLDFGNPGQLDAGGVVTHGAGDGIRIVVQARDAQADYRGPLTLSAHQVNYPVDFAARGQFSFQAQPHFPVTVVGGEYSGALTFVVSYQ
ncbi:fimbrial protein [Edwardsiella hoshinae]|uniref:Fimbrial protein n=1 Tax=Edwardsiella hoshinae TaxID=93378 RepID=A0ABN4SYX3_9GAMM|nr:fimbrial protein [Edwardsiella hoshinae]AOV97506.1 fimbrial protein [Edwardsiella hoshinae]AOV97685.1 fimbrial protein [Edwardsiella hoshinae]AOV98203.1 fimbrial protein [Edwardsiella hoshinae]